MRSLQSKKKEAPSKKRKASDDVSNDEEEEQVSSERDEDGDDDSEDDEYDSETLNSTSILKGLDSKKRKLSHSKRKANGNDWHPATPGSRSSMIKRCTIDLTNEASENKSSKRGNMQYHATAGRDKEILRCIEILNCTEKNNPLLVGEAGVGKTQIVRGIAMEIVRGNVPERLKNRRVLQVDLKALLAGAKYVGDVEERVQKFLDELRAGSHDDRPIIFIDEMHVIVGAGTGGHSAHDVANQLKPALAEGLRCIGATTPSEFASHLSKDPALVRRFERVLIEEPSVEKAIEMVHSRHQALAECYEVKYDREALNAAVTFSHRYIHDRRLPDKAISLLDWAGSRAQVMGRHIVDKKFVAELVADAAKVPVERILLSPTERLTKLRQSLDTEVVGQTLAKEALCKLLRKYYAGMGIGKAMGTLLFMGPHGVGKSKLAKVFSEIAFDGSLLRLDVSMTNDLPEAVFSHLQRRPYSLILLERVETKPDHVARLIGQATDEGYILGQNGLKVDCSNALFILGSNLDNSAEVNQATLTSMVQKAFTNDLIDRLDCIVQFHPLQAVDMQSLVKSYLTKYSEIVRAWDLKGLTYDNQVVDFLISKSVQDVCDARLVQKMTDLFVEELLIDAKLKETFKRGQTFHLSLKWTNGHASLDDAFLDLSVK